MGVEKSFAAFDVAERLKMPYAKFQLEESADDWWKNERALLLEAVDWNGFKPLFYKNYFPKATRDKMLGQLWALKQGGRTVAEYEAEFNRLMKFAPAGIKQDEETKVQKFRDGLNLELQLDTQNLEAVTLRDIVNKAKATEEVRNKMRVQDDAQKNVLGKRSYGSYEPRKFETGSGSGSYKRPAYEKSSVSWQGQTQVQSSASAAGTVDKPGSGVKVICERCKGPHPVSECKWKVGACFSCGQVGHRVTQCKNPVLKTVFCYHCRPWGHVFS